MTTQAQPLTRTHYLRRALFGLMLLLVLVGALVGVLSFATPAETRVYGLGSLDRFAPDTVTTYAVREGRLLERVETDRDDLKLLARRPVEILQSVHHAVERDVADQRAGVVIQRQDHRALIAEVVPQMDLVGVLVVELEVHGNARVELLRDADAFQLLRSFRVFRARRQLRDTNAIGLPGIESQRY